MYLKIEQRQMRFTPASISTFERKVLGKFDAGDRVLWAVARKSTLADANTLSRITLGDWDDPDGFVTADLVDEQVYDLGSDTPLVTTGDLDLETGTEGTDYVDGSGAYLQRSGGKLYTAPAFLIATYEPGGDASAYGTTVPSVVFYVGVIHHSV